MIQNNLFKGKHTQKNSQSPENLRNKFSFKNFLSFLILITTPVFVFYFMEFFTHNPFETMKLPVHFLNITFFELFLFSGLFLFKKAKIALRIEILIFGIIGLINYYVLEFRAAPMMPWDIFSIKTAASVADNYSYQLDKNAIFILFLLVSLFSISGFCNFSVKNNKIRLSGFVLSLCFIIGYVGYVQSDKALQDFRLYDKLFTPTTMTYKDGTIVAFCMQAEYLFVEKPQDYSVQKAENILDSYHSSIIGNATAKPESSENKKENNSFQAADTSVDQFPNIIVIMNEAFSDLNILGSFSSNKEDIPYVRSMLNGAPNTISGYMHVSVLGGNTANSEFEFLTGQTMAFLPQGSIPYQQYVDSETFSLASHLKSLGYSTVALHPYKAGGWERDQVYPRLGFDSFLSINDFENAKLIRKYVSDESDYEKIIDIYKNKEKDTPLFLFNVTMQNHSSYNEEFDNFQPDITVTGSDSRSLSAYLSLLKISDEEMQKLVQYFETESEKTIVVFFGDHQPTDSVVSDLWKLNGKKGSDLSYEDRLLRYQVPFFLWANYDIEEQTGIESSLNYLGNFILNAAGLPKSDYHYFLDALYENYPVITGIQAKDAKGYSYEIKSCKDALNEYAILQYYHLFDNQYSVN